MRQVNKIIIHCTATRADWWKTRTTNQKVREIKRWHVEDRGWSDIGYHFLIDRNGTVAKGRDVSRVGAHVRGQNTGSIGISLFGGHGSSEKDSFHDNFTPEQDKALRGLIADLQGKYGPLTLHGHNNFAAKACPGFTVSKWEHATSPAPKLTPKPIEPTSLQKAQTTKRTGWLTTFFAALLGRKS